MRIGLNCATPSFDDIASVSLNENRITARDLLDLMQLGHLDTCRFLKIPKTKNDTLQTININPTDLGSTLAQLGFRDNTNYTVIPLN